MDVRAFVFITGFMASGKTTLGRIAAEASGMEFIDLDEMVEASAGRSVPEIFAVEGEAAFRARECEALSKVLANRPAGAVVALGGGAWAQRQVREMVPAERVAWLDVPLATLRRRALGSGRPLAQEERAFDALFAARSQAYSTAGSRVVLSGTESIEEAADQLISVIRKLRQA